MTGSWATSGVDLHVDVQGGGLRAGLERALREAVRAGRLAPGSRLPSSRALAADLGIARNTVADAYSQLVAEGWLEARQGSGTRVAEQAPAAGPLTAVGAAPAGRPRFDLPGGSAAGRPRFDLRAGSPDLAAFPRSAWLTAARRALAAAPYDALGYGDPRGSEPLRRGLAEYLGRTRGVRAGPERIVVCSGFTQGLSLVSGVLRARGAASLAVEAYSYRAHRETAAAAGLRLRVVPVDAHGADVGQFGDADAALLTPAHQLPLGVALAPRRRTRAVEWAQRTGGVVIEDDYDGEFRYDRQPVGAMQALAPEHVVYAGTASKTLAPGVRLGWLVLPADLVDDVAAAKALVDGQTGAIEQLVLAELLATGAYDRHVRRSRLTYRRRRDRLVAALAGETPVTGIAAGLHAVVELPADVGEQEVVERAARRDLAVQGLAAYAAAESSHGPALVVGYGTPPDHAFTAALARLGAALTLGR